MHESAPPPDRFMRTAMIAAGIRLCVVAGFVASGVAVAGEAGLPVGGLAPASDCLTLRNRFEAVHKAGDLEAMKSIAHALGVAVGCDDQYRVWARTAVARELTRRVRSLVSTGTPLASQAETLEQALAYGQIWQAAAWLGDIAYDAGAFADATRRYQQALTDIADENATRQAPPVDVIERLFRQAELARLAADSYVTAPRARSGEPSGLNSRAIRGFVPTKVALPLDFQFGTTLLTPRGAEAARDLLSGLLSTATPAITLVGHTDPVGAAPVNQALSERRAAAIRDFLLANGYTGRVSVIGRGAGDPLKLDDPSRFTTEQYHQMLRRVEVVRQ